MVFVYKVCLTLECGHPDLSGKGQLVGWSGFVGSAVLQSSPSTETDSATGVVDMKARVCVKLPYQCWV